jgi:hypothetical protein
LAHYRMKWLLVMFWAKAGPATSASAGPPDRSARQMPWFHHRHSAGVFFAIDTDGRRLNTFSRYQAIPGGIIGFTLSWIQNAVLPGIRLATLMSDLFRANIELGLPRSPPTPRPATAYFAPGNVEREIARLSQRFGATPHILQSPRWSRSLAQLAAGQSVTKGMLFDFIGNFGDSAREGPIFQLGGASGYVWSARFDENGKGQPADDRDRCEPAHGSLYGCPWRRFRFPAYPPLETRRSVSPRRTCRRSQRPVCRQVPAFS